MPRNDYKCPECGIIELYVKVGEPSPQRCPDCDSRITIIMPKVNSNFAPWMDKKKREIAYALGDDDHVVDPKNIPNKPQREI